ncbi:MAG TPA: hypothetical protein VH161_03275 [Candidatus Acidoferrales bacterium]|jgi:hypothetical protein|nr:hypothetical protein [Candidatus Acidoferrales bacterium]
MKKHRSIFRAAALVIALIGAAPWTSAHERDTFKIGEKYYVLTVGSLNEPFVVDSISGVDLRVSQTSGQTGSAGGKGAPVTGLERTLKVELAAGNKKQTLSFEPSHEAPGTYAANFIPTVQTTYGYRIFGTIETSAVDLTFACVPGEVSESAEDHSQVKISETVTRVAKIGGFGCPAARKALGFPEPALSSYEMNQSTQNLAAAAQAAGKQSATAEAVGIAGFVLGFLGLALAAMAWKQTRAGSR